LSSIENQKLGETAFIISQQGQTQRNSLLFKLAIIEFVVSLSSFLPVLQPFLSGQSFSFVALIFGIVAVSSLGFGIWLAKRNFYLLGSVWLIIFTSFAVATAILTSGIQTACFMVWPIILAGMLLDRRMVWVVGGCCSALFLLVYFVEYFAVFSFLNILSEIEKTSTTWVTYITLYALITLGTSIFTGSLQRALSQVQAETANLAKANEEVSQKRELGFETGTKMAQVATSLGVASRQQAEGANEQAQAVLEVTSSMEELLETARHIAQNATEVGISADMALASANEVHDNSIRASESAENGQTSLEDVIIAIEVVKNRIELLGQKLLNLTERSKEVGNIIGLINEIADETHLLALNAAIESAGSGESGRRFSVIANQVKSLADRSIEATKDVQRVIAEVQGSVAESVLTAEEGKKETARAVEKSYRAGLVINQLGETVNQTAISSRKILGSIELVHRRSEEITLATRQQKSASEQIVTTMRSVGSVAQQSASASYNVQVTVEELQNYSSKLTGTLAE